MMRRTSLCALWLWLGAVAVWAAQSEKSEVMSATLRSHLQSDRFQIVSSMRGFPLGLRDRLSEMFGAGYLDIVDPGKDFQGTRPAGPGSLSLRRLIAGGCATDNHCLVYYERGGATVTRRVVLFHWTPDATTFVWGGAAPGGMATIDTVVKAILAGTLRGGEAGPW